jgi:hypothetical protein
MAMMMIMNKEYGKLDQKEDILNASVPSKTKNKLRGLSSRANYTDRHFLDNWLTEGSEVVSLTRLQRFTPQRDCLVLISVRGCVNLRAIVRLGGLRSL